jgi:FKBP-type peptidyl-prolyl cis-trans isomerase
MFGLAALLVAACGPALGADEPPAATPTLIPPPPSATSAAQLAGLDTPEGKLGYALGLRIGKRIAADFKAQDTAVDPAALARGLADAILDAAPLLGEEAVTEALDRFEAGMREKERLLSAKMAERGKANAAAAEEFLESHARRRGIQVSPGGVQYEVLRAGKGPKPRPDQEVSVHYRGTHLDGREFDRSDPAAEPVRFPIGSVIPGWQQVLPLMAVGSKWRIVVPPALGYGSLGSLPDIEPNEALIFEIELIAVVADGNARQGSPQP